MILKDSVGPELVKPIGIDHVQMLTEERAAIHKLLQRERRRAQIAKWTAVTSLAVFVACVATLGVFTVLSRQGPSPASAPSPLVQSAAGLLAVISVILPLPALVLGGITAVMAVIFSRSADRQALLAHLAQVESILRQPPNDRH